jgi:hypothetical protein
MKRILTVGLMMVGLLAGSALADGDLAKNFAAPPASARPWVYWFALNGNLTKEGITADLEAMARVGIGGVLYMEVDQGAPKGKADFASPLWRELIKHACNEAHRLGLEINMNNAAGWTGSGGPWVTQELSMQIVVWTETVVEGGKPFEGALAKPQANKGYYQDNAVKGYYQDIAVLAMPAPGDDKFRLKSFESKSALDITVYFNQSPASFPDAPQDAVIPREKIVDVTAKMDAAGKLTWDPPAGKWLVIRFGHTTTGWGNMPAPESGRGLECDKFSKEAAAAHYNGLMGKLIADNKPLAGQARGGNSEDRQIAVRHGCLAQRQARGRTPQLLDNGLFQPDRCHELVWREPAPVVLSTEPFDLAEVRLLDGPFASCAIDS